MIIAKECHHTCLSSAKRRIYMVGILKKGEMSCIRMSYFSFKNSIILSTYVMFSNYHINQGVSYSSDTFIFSFMINIIWLLFTYLFQEEKCVLISRYIHIIINITEPVTQRLLKATF